MQPAHHVLSAVALALLSATSFASTATYNSSASFLPHVSTGGYTENFNGLGNPPSGPALFSSGGYSYAVSAPGDLYASGDFLGGSLPYESLTINFTSGNVTAVGGNFFSTDIGDAFTATSITLLLSDLTTVVFTPTSASDSYFGFSSNNLITSLTVTAGNLPFNSLYAAIDNLTVGAAVPEPASLSLVGLALAGLAITRRRKA